MPIYPTHSGKMSRLEKIWIMKVDSVVKRFRPVTFAENFGDFELSSLSRQKFRFGGLVDRLWGVHPSRTWLKGWFIAVSMLATVNHTATAVSDDSAMTNSNDPIDSAGQRKQRLSPVAQPFLHPLAGNYITFGLARNFPMGLTQRRLTAGQWHPLVGFRHTVRPNWAMSLRAQFRLLNHKDSQIWNGTEKSGELPIVSLTHESTYIWRLYHPTYLELGFQIIYLAPTQSAKLPVRRDSVIPTEIGTGATIGVSQIIQSNTLVFMRLVRWRGTKTSKLQGLETSIGVAVKI